jgi:hypothetical protein
MPKAKSKEKKITFTIVGLSYHVTPVKLQAISEDTPLRAKLVREPENPADRNAVAIHLDERPYKDFKVGYLAREVAIEIASRMDRGKLEPREVWLIEVDPDDNTGTLVVKL